MQARRMGWSAVLMLVGVLGCSGSKDAGHPSSEPSAPATTPSAETKPEPSTTPAPATTPSTEPPPSTATAPSTETTPPSGDCAGICYRDLPKGGCESMPTCCPKTVHLKVPPHCPANYTLDLNSGPDRCTVRHLCVD